MDDYQERLTITLSGKTHTAMLTFLQKNGGNSQDVSRFVEDAIKWRILDRQIALRKAVDGEEVSIYTDPKTDGEEERLTA